MIYLRKTQEEIRDYNYDHTLTAISHSQFLKIIQNYHSKAYTNTDTFPLVSTLHNPCDHPPLCNNYFPVIDCDKLKDKLECIKYLREKGHSWVEFQSSRDRSWIIVRYSTHIEECIRFMRSLPGDERYTDVCEMDKQIVLRAYRKHDSIPIAKSLNITEKKHRYYFSSNYGIFKFLRENSSCVFCNWVSEFMFHWAQYGLIELNCNSDFIKLNTKLVKKPSSFSFLKLEL